MILKYKVLRWAGCMSSEGPYLGQINFRFIVLHTEFELETIVHPNLKNWVKMK